MMPNCLEIGRNQYCLSMLLCQTNAPREQDGHFVNSLQCLTGSVYVAVGQDVFILLLLQYLPNSY